MNNLLALSLVVLFLVILSGLAFFLDWRREWREKMRRKGAK